MVKGVLNFKTDSAEQFCLNVLSALLGSFLRPNFRPDLLPMPYYININKTGSASNAMISRALSECFRWNRQSIVSAILFRTKELRHAYVVFYTKLYLHYRSSLDMSNKKWRHVYI